MCEKKQHFKRKSSFFSGNPSPYPMPHCPPHCWTWLPRREQTITLTTEPQPTVATNNNHLKQPFNGCLSGTTWVGWYQKKHSPAHTHPGQRTSFITLLHLQRSTASSLFSLRAWQSSRTTSFQVLFGLPLGLMIRYYMVYLCAPKSWLLAR